VGEFDWPRDSSTSFSTAGVGCSSSASSWSPSLQILQKTGSDGSGAELTGGDSPSSYIAMSFMAIEEGNTRPVRKHVKVEFDSNGSDERVLALSCGSSSLAVGSGSSSFPSRISSSSDPTSLPPEEDSGVSTAITALSVLSWNESIASFTVESGKVFSLIFQ
jgi:hypothetical protein